MLYREGGAVIVKFSHRIWVELTGASDRGWGGPDPWIPLINSAPNGSHSLCSYSLITQITKFTGTTEQRVRNTQHC